MRHKILGIVSAKGGVGKTTVAINLGAAAINNFDKSVLILDANVNTGNVGLCLGLTYSPTNICDAIKNKFSLLHSIYTHSSGLHIIPSSLTLEKREINPSVLKRKLKKLLSQYDIILLDSAPGLGDDAQLAIRVADKVVVVVTPDFPAIGTALKTIELTKRLKTPVIGIILNRVRNRKYEVTKKDIEASLGLPVVAVIPEDQKVQESVSARVPIVLYDLKSPASVAFGKLPVQIFGDSVIGKLKKLRTFLPIKVPRVPSFFDRLLEFFNLKNVRRAVQKMKYNKDNN